MKINTKLPPDSHPDAVAFGIDGPSRDAIHHAASTLYDTFSKIDDLAGQVQDKSILAVKAQPAIERALKQSAKTIDSIGAQIQALQNEMDSTFRADDSVGAEIRAHIAKQKHPAAAATKLLLTQDVRTAKAILSAPAYLSGLEFEQQEKFRTLAESTLFSTEAKHRDMLIRSKAKLARAQEVFTKRMTDDMKDWANTDADRIGKELAE